MELRTKLGIKLYKIFDFTRFLQLYFRNPENEIRGGIISFRPTDGSIDN